MKTTPVPNIYDYLLPEGITEYFEVSTVHQKEDVLTLVLEERNIYPEGYQDKKLESKGFYPSSFLEDFPIRKNKVYLEIRRRKWRDSETGTTVSRDWHLTAKGTSYTKEFASFLKRVGWTPLR
ncbi:MAG: transposase [Cyclobacteriaceae bacterium]|nr:transposase [Cyclobacteriaceae bacterium]